MAFVSTIPHAQVMQALIGHIGQTAFLRWTVKGDAVPLKWKEALAWHRREGSTSSRHLAVGPEAILTTPCEH